MRAVVTGGAGFIGSHIVDALLAEGCSVLVIDDYSTGTEENLASAQASAGSLELCKSSIVGSDAASAITDFKPEILFHLAAQIDVRRSVREPVFDAEVNLLGTVNVLESFRLAGGKSFVLSSTGGAIYGEQEEFPATEQHPCSPECPYGVSKRASEVYLEHYAKAHGLTCVSLRYANVYGPRQNPHGEAGVVAIFTERLLAGQALRINGDGEQTRDFVFVEDVVAANMLASSKLNTPGYFVYNVGTGVETSVLDVVEALRSSWNGLEQSAGRGEMVVEHGPEPLGEQKRSVVDPTKIVNDLGWSSNTPFVKGIDLTIRSFL